MLHLPTGLADLAGGKIDITSKIPPLLTELVSISGHGLRRCATPAGTIPLLDTASSPLLVRSERASRARSAGRDEKKRPPCKSTAGEILGKQKLRWGITHPTAHDFIMHLCVFTVRTPKDCQSLQKIPQMFIRHFAKIVLHLTRTNLVRLS